MLWSLHDILVLCIEVNRGQLGLVDSPEHVCPLPEYPVLQAHENDPTVSVHVASAWQLCVPSVHSLGSDKQNTNSCYMNIPWCGVGNKTLYTILFGTFRDEILIVTKVYAPVCAGKQLCILLINRWNQSSMYAEINLQKKLKNGDFTESAEVVIDTVYHPDNGIKPLCALATFKRFENQVDTK